MYSSVALRAFRPLCDHLQGHVFKLLETEHTGTAQRTAAKLTLIGATLPLLEAMEIIYP